MINAKLDVTTIDFEKKVLVERRKWKWHDGTSDLPKPIFSCVCSVRTFTNVTFDKYIMDTCAVYTHICTETWNITVYVL